MQSTSPCWSFLRISVILIFMAVCSGTAAYGQSSQIKLENDSFMYLIGSDGKNLGFIDKKTGIDYCNHQEPGYFASVMIGGTEYPASSLSLDGSCITAKFGTLDVEVVFKISIEPEAIFFEITSLEGNGVDSLSFLNVPLTLKGMPDDPFAACVLSLNLQTRVLQTPALQTHLAAECYARFGIRGSKIALLGVPQKEILPTIKKIMSNANEIPHSTVGGAWSQDVPENHGSIVFNMGTLTTQTVDEWIEMVKGVGATHIENHGGRRFFRFGDFQLLPEKWPNGWDDFKAINEKLHQAGIQSILHTYTYLIDQMAQYVTPVPDRDLAYMRTFTLAEPLDETATDIRVIESVKDVSTIAGSPVYNSLTLHIEDELITFSGISKEPPYALTGCTRGALGTRISSHPQGARVCHLAEFNNLFAPVPDSRLFKEIARRHAEIIDYCGFDGIYLDAFGALRHLVGEENKWYYCTKFVFEIMKNLKKPVTMGYSSMYHHVWHYRACWQAWDYPTRGHKRFIDIHADDNNRGCLLPLHLGWWSFQTWNPPQVEASYSDVIEYLGCKLIGYNASITTYDETINRQNLEENPIIKSSVNILKRYEDLRRADYFDESIKSRLREPGKEFTMFKDTNGKWKFRRIHYNAHKIEGINHWSSSWQAENPFGNQRAALRIEALMSASSYDDPANMILADFTDTGEFSEKKSAEGVACDLQTATEYTKSGAASGKLIALNSGKTVQNASWSSLRKTFSPWRDLEKHQALGVWIYGDGRGELLNFRIRSPYHISRAIADHYVMIDFSGWRYFELIETESSRHRDYVWPAGEESVYYLFRDFAKYGNIETFSLMYNNLPPGEQVVCYISPVKALPMIPITVKNPAVIINGKKITFPTEMNSGDYLEFNAESGCTLYGSKGEFLGNVHPQGEAPMLRGGVNQALFDCDGSSNVSIRAKVTIISTGEAL